jgi:hypothetical protein
MNGKMAKIERVASAVTNSDLKCPSTITTNPSVARVRQLSELAFSSELSHRIAEA